MKFNKTLEYAISAMDYLARTNNFVSAKTIAKHTGLPMHYLPKILKNLTKAGVLVSVRGLGYTLAKSTDEISIKTLSDAIDRNGSFLPNGNGILLYNGLKDRIDKLLSEIKLSEVINNKENKVTNEESNT